MKNYSKEELEKLEIKDLTEIAKEKAVEDIPKDKQNLIEFIFYKETLSMLYKHFLEEKDYYEKNYKKDITNFNFQLKEDLSGINREIEQLLLQKQALIFTKDYYKHI